MHPSWQPLFDNFDFSIIDELYSSNTIVYPPKDKVFRAFDVDVKQIKVVIIGQDPYHGPGQAHGLSFSVPKNINIQPSLRNIYKEIKSEFPERNYNFTHGSLERWADEENIFLINASLTVEQHKPTSHMGIWCDLLNEVISYINKENPNCVYLLLGNFARDYRFIISDKTKIVEGVHPSPYSANNGFFGSDVFKKVEAALNSPINWSI